MSTLYSELQKELYLISKGVKAGRSAELQNSYDSYRKTKEAQDFIKQTLDQVKKEIWVVKPNVFPYDLLLNQFPGFKHEVLWYTSMQKSEAYNLISKIYEGYDIAFIENDCANKSILEINHIHVFSRKQEL